MRGFSSTADEGLARQFPKLAGAVTDVDRSGAAAEIIRTDGNGDGIVTEAEWEASGYQPGRFKSKDLNGDGRLSVFEHTLSWTQWRLGASGAAGRAPSRRTAAGRQSFHQRASLCSANLCGADSRTESRQRQTQELAAYTVPLYDRNRNGVVDHSELQATSPFGNVAAADADRDGVVTQQELAAWLARVPRGAARVRPAP